jgi:anti-sigma factor RsiW
MQCNRAQEQFSDYVEGALSPAMRQVLEQHLGVCAPCRNDVEEFARVFALLEEGLPEVEPPPGFRSAVLNTISRQPAPETLLTRLRSILTPVGATRSRRAAFGAAAAAIAIAAVGSGAYFDQQFQADRSVRAPAIESEQSTASLGPLSSAPVEVRNKNGILQGVTSYSSNGDAYHVFGLHLPGGAAATTASAYVIQAPGALASDAALRDPTLATLVWSGAIKPGDSIDLPLGVVSGVPAGSSMTLLVEWSENSEQHKELCIVPVGKPQTGSLTVSAGEPLEQALETVAVGYATTIAIDGSASSQLTKPIARGLGPSDTSIDSSLADLLLPSNLSFRQQKDGSYLIDSQ